MALSRLFTFGPESKPDASEPVDALAERMQDFVLYDHTTHMSLASHVELTRAQVHPTSSPQDPPFSGFLLNYAS